MFVRTTCVSGWICLAVIAHPLKPVVLTKQTLLSVGSANDELLLRAVGVGAVGSDVTKMLTA